MAHFTKISEQNIVLSVHAVNDSDCTNSDGVETESVGQTFLENVHGWPAHLWKQTSYNTLGGKHYTITTDSEGNTIRSESADQSQALRGNYAGAGYTWDEDNEIFWPRKPHASWTKDVANATWVSPLGNPPALTSEQESQNTAVTNFWEYTWDEDAYQADNTTGWVLTDLQA